MVPEVTSRTELLPAAAQVQQDTFQRSQVEQSAHQPAESHSATIEAGDLQKAVEKVREVFQNVEPRLQFEIDPDLHRVIVKIMNGESGEVIRQIPPEEVLDLARNFQASTGLLLKQQA
jgi:flagellar protein FlaG